MVKKSLELNPGQNQWITLPISCEIKQPGWHFLILKKNSNIAVHVIESPSGRLRYYPTPEDAIRPNPYSNWTFRSLTIGQKKANDADWCKSINTYME